MFSNPLKQAAEEYLSTKDDAVRDQFKQQLIRAGSSAVAPLVDALIVRFRQLSANVMGKKEMDALTDEMERQGILTGTYLEELREQFRDTPDRKGPGMSIASALYSIEACSRAWQVISQIGELGVRALFDLINGRDKRMRLAAVLAFSGEENPSRFLVNSLMISAPFQEVSSGSDLENATQMLAVRTLALSGDRHAQDIIEQFCSANNVSETEFRNDFVERCIYLLLK